MKACSSTESFIQTLAIVGRRVNEYQIVRCLDRGGVAGVYEGVHATLGNRVAFKVLRREVADEPLLVRRFFNEARVAHAVAHPNIVRVFNTGVMADGLPYLMMELLQGETLAQRIARAGWLQIHEALHIALQAAGALGAAHARGIVHRDVKPANLFLSTEAARDNRSLVKLLDFGIAKLQASASDIQLEPVETLLGARLGTPAYMSPEQWHGHPTRLDQCADVYALGVVLYEMVCGVPPFMGGYADLRIKQMTAQPPAPSLRRPDLPVAVENAILRALAKDPAQRFGSMAALSAALGPLAPAPVVVASRTGWLQGSGGSRRSWHVGIAALAVLVALAGVLTVGLRNRSRPTRVAAATSTVLRR
jgi:serine/threonine protein kinase